MADCSQRGLELSMVSLPGLSAEVPGDRSRAVTSSHHIITPSHQSGIPEPRFSSASRFRSENELSRTEPDLSKTSLESGLSPEESERVQSSCSCRRESGVQDGRSRHGLCCYQRRLQLQSPRFLCPRRFSVDYSSRDRERRQHVS